MESVTNYIHLDSNISDGTGRHKEGLIITKASKA